MNVDKIIALIFSILALIFLPRYSEITRPIFETVTKISYQLNVSINPDPFILGVYLADLFEILMVIIPLTILIIGLIMIILRKLG
ncbi:MAG: hypothetical protein QXE60_04755 [Candidatus Methanomethylicaceae archaeon]